MKSFAVIGLGRFGSNLAKTLFSLGYEVMAVDEDEERVARISDYVTHAVVGDARDEGVLKSIGIRNVDCVVVALSGDMQSSILVTLLLKEMGVKFILSKAMSEVHARVLTKVGADQIVFPEKDMGMRVAQSLAMNNILDFIELSEEYSIVEVVMPERWAGKTLRDLNVRANYGVNIMAIRHEQTKEISVSPNPDEELIAGDALIIIGTNDDITQITKL
ncbi:potassium channel family protein [Feifania hominis]|uniref:TrkA family potassium uptake protein n=1 Tax=Feifania hominis TaxID=2763660 RepID=A0A926DCB9_9FIRM|nr:TrkA family potassium uptake protein [Feifania hominis]MBC8535211.1 TrkA family potassium uptake protein [Feifania hominis]